MPDLNDIISTLPWVTEKEPELDNAEIEKRKAEIRQKLVSADNFPELTELAPPRSPPTGRESMTDDKELDALVAFLRDYSLSNCEHIVHQAAGALSELREELYEANECERSNHVRAEDNLRLAMALREENVRLRGGLDNESMRLAACGCAAIANTAASAESTRIGLGHPYYSASYASVCDAVDREMAERERAAKAEAALAECRRDAERMKGRLDWVLDDSGVADRDACYAAIDALIKRERETRGTE